MQAGAQRLGDRECGQGRAHQMQAGQREDVAQQDPGELVEADPGVVLASQQRCLAEVLVNGGTEQERDGHDVRCRQRRNHETARDNG